MNDLTPYQRRECAAMGLILKIAAGILLAGLIGWMVVDFTSFRHKFAGYSNEEINKSWEEVREHEQKVQPELDNEILRAKIRTAVLSSGRAESKHAPKRKHHLTPDEIARNKEAENRARQMTQQYCGQHPEYEYCQQ
jgi:hypothetical protein